MVAPARAPGLDPAVFRPEAIDPETAAYNLQLRQLMAGQPHLSTMTPAVIRGNREAGRGPMGPLVLSNMAVDRTIAGPGGEVTLRTFVPQTIEGVYLHLHGGGWVLGNAHMQDTLLEGLAGSQHLAVLSVDYRLAPEFPYPAGPDDCEAAALWLARHAKSEYGTDRLLIGGESAGAHLAAVTLLRLRDRHQLRLFSAANLLFGVYDLSQTPSSVNATDTLIIDQLSMKWFADHFVAAERRREPDVSPLFAELRGMPPAIFSVGTLDPLLDDTLFMYSRWLAAGNEAELAVYAGGVHGFTGHPLTIGRQAYERIGRFLGNATHMR